jgi:hypothetical protein
MKEAVEEEKEDFARSSSMRRTSTINHDRLKPAAQLDQIDIEETYEELDDFMADILLKVMKEFNIQEKWSNLLAEFVDRAINTVKPSSFAFKDSIDITKYVKIQLVQFKDTSKSAYVNGVVINKSIAHKRMKW